jgi:hypothetical protein
MMKAKTLPDFKKELIAAERCGCPAIREICDEAIEMWGSDSDRLADLADLILQQADLGGFFLQADG